MGIGSVVDGRKVDCIFDLWSVAAGGTTVGVISDCRWMTAPEFGLLNSSSMRRSTAVSLCAWMKTCIYVGCVQPGRADKMVLVVFEFHGGSYFLNWYRTYVWTDRDGDAVRT